MSIPFYFFVSKARKVPSLLKNTMNHANKHVDYHKCKIWNNLFSVGFYATSQISLLKVTKFFSTSWKFNQVTYGNQFVTIGLVIFILIVLVVK